MLERLIDFLRRKFYGIQVHRVTYLARGFMGNEYIAGTFDVETTWIDRKHFSVENLGFLENRDKLERHYKASSNGSIFYRAYVHPKIEKRCNL